MADINTVRTIRVRGVDEGLDALRGKLQGVAAAQDGVARSSDAMGAATERVGRRQLSAQAAFDRVQRSLDDQFRAQEKIARVERDLQRAYDQGLVSAQRRVQLLDAATQRFGAGSSAAAVYASAVDKAAAGANDNFVRSAGLARHELINLGRQVQDVGTMFAMGASPMQIFASQAAQIGDIFASTSGSIGGFMRQVGGGFARFATSGLGLATAGAGASVWGAVAASNFADGQREIERALHGVGAASGVTLAAVNRLADGQAAAAKVSVASAREMAAAYAGTGKVNPTQLPGLLDFTRQFGAMQGLDNADAAQELAKAFADPSRGAEALADKLGGLNSATQRWIAQQQAAGNMLGAQASLMDAFRVQVEGSTDRLGFFARAWDGVKRSVSDADDALGRFLAGSATVQHQLDALRAQRDRFALLPTRTQRAQDYVAGLDAEIRKLEAIVELDRQRAAIEERFAKAANRDAQDALRASRDQLALAGKSPADRFRIEQEQRYRDNSERFGGVNTTMPATTAAASGLDAAFAEALRKLMAAVPGLGITSGFRTFDEQARLYREKGPGWAAPPGSSRHESGMAVDLNYRGSGQIPAWIREEAAKYGIGFPLANRARNPEPWHAEPAGGRGRASSNDNNTAAAEIYRNAFSARELEAADAVIGNANRELEKQTQLLNAQRVAWGQSTEEAAKAAKAQELVNSFWQQGVAVGPGLMQQINATAAAYGRLAQQQEDLRRSQEAWRTVGDLGRDTLRGIYSDLRNGATGAEIFQNALDRLASKLLDMALNDLFGKAFGNNAMGLFGSGGFFSSIFGGFGGGGLGLTPGSGGLYAEGGYTGPGGKYQPAGVVHRGEVVWSQADVHRAGGVSAVEAMRLGMRGYAEGGYVHAMSSPYIHPPAANANGGSGALNVEINNSVSDQADVRAERGDDDKLRIFIDAVKGEIAQDVVRGQGAVPMAMKAVGSGRQWRG